MEIPDVLWTKVVKKIRPFKAVENDCIPGFYLKKFPSVCMVLRTVISQWINGDRQTHDWLVEGRTRLVPKTTPTSNLPKDYRPIAVLNTTYKLLTSVIAGKLQEHLQRYDLVPPE